jgi:hypothetical protein
MILRTGYLSGRGTCLAALGMRGFGRPRGHAVLCQIFDNPIPYGDANDCNGSTAGAAIWNELLALCLFFFWGAGSGFMGGVGLSCICIIREMEADETPIQNGFRRGRVRRMPLLGQSVPGANDYGPGRNNESIPAEFSTRAGTAPNTYLWDSGEYPHA